MMTEKEILVSLIRFLESNEDIRERYRNEIEKFKQQLEQAKLDRYRLGVIGVTSSGKSTMINAIMKKELLTMAVRPSSSQLVTCSKSTGDRVTVYFRDKPPKIETGRSLNKILEKYGDEKYNPGNELGVKQLEVSTPTFSFPQEVLLIDSPGLDAYGYEGHEKLTMSSLLPTIDFCIFVTTFKTNSDEKMKSVLDVIADYDCPLIIVQNMLDSLKPSPDGKKSVNEVAAEHRQRLERIVKHSRIKNKNSVHIIQISSKLALEAFTNRLLLPQVKKQKLKMSNFDKLVNTVNLIFNEIRPKIEHRRSSGIKKQIGEIVKNAREDLRATEEERKALRFDYAGYDKKIISTFQAAQNELQKVIDRLENEKTKWAESFNSDKMKSGERKLEESDLDGIKEFSKKCRERIVDVTADFLNDITAYCDVFGIDARRLRVMDSFGAAPQLVIHTKTKPTRVKKRSFGSGIARFFGGLFGTDWGYETITKKEYDNEGTKQNVMNYFDSVIYSYSSSCGKWADSAQTQVNLLLQQYQNSHDSYEARKNILLGKEKMKTVIAGLEKLMGSIPDTVKAPVKKSASVKNTDFRKKMYSATLGTGLYAMTKLADKIRSAIHQSVFRAITGLEHPDNCVVIGWDSDSTAMFVNQSFQYNYALFDTGITCLENMKVLVKPSKENIVSLMPKKSEERYIFIVFNTAQFGSGLNDFSHAGIEKILSAKDKVYFVVQDLAELIVGEGIREGIQNMLSVHKTLSLKVQYKIMLNHRNPVYNLLAGELQSNPCITHSDEIALLNDIQQKFPYLRDPETDKHLSEIMAGFRNK